MRILKEIDVSGVDVFEHPLLKQQKRIKEVLYKLEHEENTLDDPLIILNPWEFAPLSALMVFETNYEAQYLIEVLGKTQDANLSYMAPVSKKHILHIWGLYPNYNNTVRLTDKAGKEHIYHIQTPPLSEMHPSANMEGKAPYNTLQLVVFANSQALPTGYDINGDIRWAFSLPLSHDIKRSLDGHLWVGGADQLTPPYGDASIWKIALDGRILETHRPTGGLVGHFVELPNHTMVLVSQSAGLTTVMDEIVWYSLTEKKELRRIRLKDYFYPTVSGIQAKCGTDWVHVRNIHYNDFDGTLWVALSFLNRVLVFDASTGQLLKFFGSLDGLKEIDLTYVNYSNQSLPFVLQDALPYKDGFVSYKMKEPHSITYFSPTLAAEDIISLPATASSPILNRLDYTNDEALSLLLGACEKNQVPGHSSLFEKNKKADALQAEYMIFQDERPLSTLVLPQAVVAAYLWHASGSRQKNLEASTPIISGTYDQPPLVDVPLPIVNYDVIDDDFQLQLSTDRQRLFIKGQVFQGEMVLLMLKSEKDTFSYYMPTSLKPYGTEWLRSYYKGPEREILFALPLKDLPQGKYVIYIVVDDTSFATDATITIKE